jgi:biotin operon repressor
MNNKQRFQKLLSVLPDTKENAIHMKELARRLEMTTRDTRQYVLEARKEGLPILSDTQKGYWEGSRDEELNLFIEQRRNVAKTIFSYTQKMSKRRERHSEKK